MYTRNKYASKVAIIVWVDDIIVAANNTQSLVEMKHYLSQRFKIKDLRPLSWYLGIEAVASRRTRGPVDKMSLGPLSSMSQISSVVFRILRVFRIV